MTDSGDEKAGREANSGVEGRNTEVLPPDEGDLEESLPPTQLISRFMAMFGSAGGAPFHPIFDKFNDKHVDKFLDHSHEEDMARIGGDRRRPWFVLAYSVLALAFLVFLVVTLLPENKDLLGEIVKLGLAFAGGLGGGYGIRAYQDFRRRD